MSGSSKLLSNWAKRLYVGVLVARRRACLCKLPGVSIGSGTRVDLATEVENHVRIGANCDISAATIGRGTYLVDGSILRHTKVGRFCAIADGVRAGIGTHPTQTFVSIHPAFFSTVGQAGFTFVQENSFDEIPRVRDSKFAVEIGNDVWIGSGVRLKDGVRIADGAIIGAGAVVTRDVEPYSVNAGVPARKLKSRFSAEQIEFLLRFRWWEKDMRWLKSNAELFKDINQFSSKLRASG